MSPLKAITPCQDSYAVCGIPKLKYSKLNGPWYCNKKSKFLIVIQTKNLKERRYEREMSFND